MKKIIYLIMFSLIAVMFLSCKEKKTLQQEFDSYIENEDFEGTKKLKGKTFAYENTRIENTLISGYPIYDEINYNTDNFYKDALVERYINKANINFTIVYTCFFVRPRIKPKGYKGADTQILDITMLNCESGYRLIEYPACKYDENKNIVKAGPVLCFLKAKINEDGSIENTTVWYKKIVPEYVVEIKSDGEIVVTKGENSEYFYYYDEDHY